MDVDQDTEGAAERPSVVNGGGGGGRNSVRDAFDIESYASKYHGYGKTARLQFIVSHSPELELDALRILHDHAKSGIDTNLYRWTVAKISGRLGGKYELDERWVERVDADAEVRLKKLKFDLETYQSSQIKESIRMGNNDLGDFFCQRGEFVRALASYDMSNDYCATSAHVMQLHLNVIRVRFYQGQYEGILLEAKEAERTPAIMHDKTRMSHLKVCQGLAAMLTKQYALAATLLTDMSLGADDEARSDVMEVLAGLACEEDIAIYGGLCALAMFDRKELKAKVIDDRAPLRAILELVPEVREMIYDFHNWDFTSSLGYLRRLRPDFELDMFLHSHLAALSHAIRQRALVQYVSPFVSVDLKLMAAAFESSAAALMEEVIALIAEHRIDARVDVHNEVLHRRSADARHDTFTSVLLSGQTAIRQLEDMLLHMQMTMQGLSVTQASTATSSNPVVLR